MKKLAVVFGLVLLIGAAAGYRMSDAEAGPLPATVRYRIDPSQSKFMVHASRAGLAWFRGESHDIAIRDFSGMAELTPDAVSPASLQMTVRAASLEETRDVFTQQQKEIINRELDEIVLETEKYPEITFQSTDVQAAIKGGRIEVKIGGDLTLHGVTRRIVIPAIVTVEGDTLRATGQFELDRKDFNVKATNAFHGLVRIGHTLKFAFDIVGRRVA